MSFANLKQNRDQISKLIQAADQAGGGEKKNYTDERIWKPTVDKAGNGYALLRFLPATEGQELPWVRYWDHGFKGPTGLWYIENSLTSISQPDPVGELNSKLWNCLIRQIQQTKVKYSFTSLVKRSSIRLWIQCNQNSLMKKRSIHLTSGKVQTSNLKLEMLKVIVTMINLSSQRKLLYTLVMMLN